jgi:hypothetical protein
MPTTTSPLTPATHGLRVAASFNPFYVWLRISEGRLLPELPRLFGDQEKPGARLDCFCFGVHGGMPP